MLVFRARPPRYRRADELKKAHDSLLRERYEERKKEKRSFPDLVAVPTRVLLSTLTPEQAKDMDIYILSGEKPILYKKKGAELPANVTDVLCDSCWILIDKESTTNLINIMKEETADLINEKIPPVEVMSITRERLKTISDIVFDIFSYDNVQAGSVLKESYALVEMFSKYFEKHPDLGYIGATTIDKEPSLAAHSTNAFFLSLGFAYFLGFRANMLVTVAAGGFFHDIGEVKIPKEILHSPFKLSDEELEIVKKHPVWGYEILKEHGFESCARIALYHHEFLDGSGYPKGAKDGEIPFEAQIVQLCSTYEALVTPRPYRREIYDSFTALLFIGEEFVKKGKIDKKLYISFLEFLKQK